MHMYNCVLAVFCICLVLSNSVCITTGRFPATLVNQTSDEKANPESGTTIFLSFSLLLYTASVTSGFISPFTLHTENLVIKQVS